MTCWTRGGITAMLNVQQLSGFVIFPASGNFELVSSSFYHLKILKYVFFFHNWMQISASEQKYDISAFVRAVHYILSQTWSGMIVAQNVFKSMTVCFIKRLFLSYRKNLAFWDFCILLVSPIVSSATFRFVLCKPPLNKLFTQNVHQRECNSANFALYITSENLLLFC